LLESSCVGHGRISLLVCSNQPQEKEEEMLALWTFCQGHGQGQEVLTSKHCQLRWLYTVGTDQVTNHLRLNIWSPHLQLQSQCVGNGGRDWLGWTPSSQDLSRPPLTVFVRLVTTFYVCPNYCVLSAITIITQSSSSWRWIELLSFMVLIRCISQSQIILIPRL
jgi:hypothetical protein